MNLFTLPSAELEIEERRLPKMPDEIEQIVLAHPDVEKHGFQYIDWQFEGDDIIFLSCTAYDDESGGANNNHDANFLTFHRIEDFREKGK
ncbi:hypothetical protein [uncultured Proteiniphilum sp.]|uniref:hypothetical protein n=1 Tax=uncultured Proteiniphilum sp. TaxID=497637 RepID=UPI0026231588|nr:hypothetical protein [uncultured Proteiniphilum sp.]